MFREQVFLFLLGLGFRRSCSLAGWLVGWLDGIFLSTLPRLWFQSFDLTLGRFVVVFMFVLVGKTKSKFRRTWQIGDPEPGDWLLLGVFLEHSTRSRWIPTFGETPALEHPIFVCCQRRAVVRRAAQAQKSCIQDGRYVPGDQRKAKLKAGLLGCWAGGLLG